MPTEENIRASGGVFPIKGIVAGVILLLVLGIVFLSVSGF
jgi:hypothetical protein